MSKYSLEECCAVSGKVFRTSTVPTMCALTLAIYGWCQVWQRRGYEVCIAPGGAIACWINKDGKPVPLRAILLEPSEEALANVRLGPKLTAPAGAPVDPNPVKGVVR